MRPPRHVQVGPHRYRVVLDKHELMEAASGLCSKERLLIVLDPLLPRSAMADTLLHELVHACLAGVRLADEQVEADRLEEQVALALGPALLCLVKENKQLIRYLTES